MDVQIYRALLLIAVIMINIVALAVMYSDKRRSEKGKRRIPEGSLLFLAIAFGAFGILLGMYMFRHKMRTWYFSIGVPLMLLQNVLSLWIVLLFLRGVV